MIREVGVLVPVHDEELLLGACIEALSAARAHLFATAGVPSRFAFVLDACSDGSADIVAAHTTPGDLVLSTSFRSVGAARDAGARALLAAWGERPLADLWLATTDADSRVPADWLAHHVAFASESAMALAGTVHVADWAGFDPLRADAYERFYASGDEEHHPHVHGCNLGFRADAYLAAGGFPNVASSEDVALWARLRDRYGGHAVHTRRNAVTTSNRLRARAPDGFASFLGAWFDIAAM